MVSNKNLYGDIMSGSAHILIVDDVIDNIQVAMNILKEDGYNFSYAKSGEDALELVKEQQIDLILLDIMMPGLDGYEVAHQLKNDPRTMDIPIIFVTAKTDVDSLEKAFKNGGVDYITKPYHAEELLARVKNHLELHFAKKLLQENNLSLEIKLQKSQERILSELEETQKEIIYTLTGLMESFSDETGKHVRRVAQYSKLLAKYHPVLTKEDEKLLYEAAPMHDIGKLAMPPEILHKHGRLTEEEFKIIQTHTTKGHEFLKNNKRKVLKAADIIAYEHHEKYNGKGYPRGLKGKDIHIYGRIVALADVFDALTHKRIYKDAWNIDEAIEYVKERSGTQFDPEIVAIFNEHLDEFIDIAKSS